jgi:hypothetical protein
MSSGILIRPKLLWAPSIASSGCILRRRGGGEELRKRAAGWQAKLSVNRLWPVGKETRVIKKVGNKVKLISKSTGKTLGTHSSRAAAERQERAIQASKAAKAKGKRR